MVLVLALAFAWACSARGFYAATYESLRQRESRVNPVDPRREAAAATSFEEYDAQRRVAVERQGD
jgi:hypothetical protein